MVRSVRLAVLAALVVLLVAPPGRPGPAAAAAARIGVSVDGGPDAVRVYERWLGRSVDQVNVYLPRTTWEAMTASARAVARRWQGSGRRLVVAVPMLPRTGATLAEGAAGRYDRWFRAVAEALVEGGQADAVIRLGWEFDGAWYAWTAWQDPPSYRAFWRRAVTAMRVPGHRFQFDWNSGNEGTDPSPLYPGDAWVDLIGLDVYDQSFGPRLADPDVRWRDLVSRPGGLAWQARFARQHGKRLSFPEWGLSTRHHPGVDVDERAFVERMHAWIRDHDVAYANYFEHRTAQGDFGLRSGRFPRAAAAYQRLFGGAPRPASPPTTTSPPKPTMPPTPTTPPTSAAPAPLPTSAPAPPPPRLAAKGLVALYRFDAGAGRLVADRAGRRPALDLVVDDPDAVRWTADGLALVRPTHLRTEQAATRLRDAVAASDELTVELWITPVDAPQDGPARILTLSSGREARNLLIGQGRWLDQPRSVFDLRVRTDRTTVDGGAALVTPTGTASGRRTHLVYTRDAAGRAVAYVDGRAVLAEPRPGRFAAWDPSFVLRLGDEAGGGRPWLGTYHVVALYDRALPAEEVAARHAAGPERV